MTSRKLAQTEKGEVLLFGLEIIACAKKEVKGSWEGQKGSLDG